MTKEEIEKIKVYGIRSSKDENKLNVFSDIEVHLIKKILLLEEQVSALTALMKAEWMAKNGYNVLYSEEAIEEGWEEFKKKYGLI